MALSEQPPQLDQPAAGIVTRRLALLPSSSGPARSGPDVRSVGRIAHDGSGAVLLADLRGDDPYHGFRIIPTAG